MPVFTPTFPPGSAKAFGVLSSNSTNSQRASGIGTMRLSRSATRFTAAVWVALLERFFSDLIFSNSVSPIWFR